MNINLKLEDQNQPDIRFPEFYYLPFKIETHGKKGFFGNFGNIEISAIKKIVTQDPIRTLIDKKEIGFGNIDVHKNDVYWKPWFTKEVDDFDTISIELDGGIQQPYKLSLELYRHIYEEVYNKKTNNL